MRTAAAVALATLLGCSSTVNPPADSGAATDVVSVDAPAVDRPDLGVPPIDIPTVDVLPVVDAPIDRPAPDVPDDGPAVDASCVLPMFVCGGACVDRETDPRNCGACGNTCLAGATCRNGSCLPCGGCAAGTSCCGTACVNLATDQNHCGSCGTVCPTGQLCTAGTCVADDCPGGGFCAGVCRRFDTDSEHCGGCGQRCCAGNTCMGGTCQPGCPAGWIACPGPMSSCRGGICVNAVTDPTHCGSCTTRCAAGETCVSGMCRP